MNLFVNTSRLAYVSVCKQAKGCIGDCNRKRWWINGCYSSSYSPVQKLPTSIERNETQQRKLGLLETMYYKSYMYSNERMISKMTLASLCFVNDNLLKTSVNELVKQHPVLATEITKSNNGEYIFKTIENFDPLKNLIIIQKENYLSVLDCFPNCIISGNYSIWKILVEREPLNLDEFKSGNSNILNLYFTWQHALADYQYAFSIVCNFLDIIALKFGMNGNRENMFIHNGIDKETKRNCIEEPIELKLSLPHHLTGNNELLYCTKETVFKISHESQIDICKENGVSVVTALNAYTDFTGQYYKPEMKYISKHILSYFSVAQTDSILTSCSQRNISVSGALMACSALSFRHILSTDKVSHKSQIMTISMEVLVTLRRFIKKYNGQTKWVYPGCAAMHVPFQLNLNRDTNRDSGSKELMDIAKNCSKSLKTVIISPDFCQQMYENILIDNQNLSGKLNSKSEYVLCISNLGDISKMYSNLQSSEMFNFLELDVAYDISGANMPLFFCSTFTLNKKLYLNVQYSYPFTDTYLAETFVQELEYLLLQINCIWKNDKIK